MSVDLPRYVFLVKNLRGVLAVAPGEAGRYAPWLARRFRYRDLGVPRCLVDSEPSAFEGRLGGNPFHVLGYPTRRVEEAASLVADLLERRGLDRCTAESLTLAAAYAAPLHASSGAIDAMERAGLVVHVVRGSALDERGARLHLRIVDYTVLDMYVETVEEAVECIRRGCGAGELLARRRERAARDERRYWRVLGRGDVRLVAYVDYAHLVLGTDLGRRLAGGEERVLLPMLAAFNLDAVGPR